MEAQLCAGEEVIVIGGGNSAGQAAIFLSQSCTRVWMLVRSDSLAESMSRYLIQRIEQNPRIQMQYQSQLDHLEGDQHLETVSWINRASKAISTAPIRHVFVMAGASPQTE